MRAAVLTGGRFSTADVPPAPPPAQGQVRIAVDSCGICGSDLTLVKDVAGFVEVARRGQYDLGIFDPGRPVVPGHEFAGTVEAVGADVEDLRVGDRVAGIGVATDPRTGLMTIIGYSNDYPGGFGELVTVDAGFVRTVPDHLSLEAASLAEPLHVGETHVQQSGIHPADTALVIGAGAIGLGVVIALAQRGCSTIVVVEPSPRRRGLAAALGAHVVEAPTDGGPVAQAAAAAAGARIVVFECSGRPGTIRDLTETLPYGSAIQVVASPFAAETIVPVIAQWRAIVLNFGGGPVEDPYGVTLQRLADGVIDPGLFITSRVGLDGVGPAFEDLRDPEAHIKIVVQPGRPD